MIVFPPYQPTLTGTLGFGYVPTLLMSAPPWVFACLVSLVNAWHSDRTQDKVRLALLFPFTHSFLYGVDQC